MYGGGMYVGGMYGGGMYGGGMGDQSKGMLALERLAYLVHPLCCTAETIEHSIQSMSSSGKLYSA
jgi:hypothetical protein